MPSGVYKNTNSEYQGRLYVNQTGQKFYLDPKVGLQILNIEVWGDDTFKRVDGVEAIEFKV